MKGKIVWRGCFEGEKDEEGGDRWKGIGGGDGKSSLNAIHWENRDPKSQL